MKIAIIGSGISGSVLAAELCRSHEITVFEAEDRIGGHTHTHRIALGGRDYTVDSGFIVFNDRTYPHFEQLLERLGVDSQPIRMSFSVCSEADGLEYCGSSLNTVFAQRRNLLRPGFYRLLWDILRFNREALALLEPGAPPVLLEDYLEAQGYSRLFAERYLVPMAAAIWSGEPRRIRAMPAQFLVRFFRNHGLLSVNDQPQWRTIRGGSLRYLEKLVEPFRDRIRTGAPVARLRRTPAGVEVRLKSGDVQCFDRVFVACHSDQALAMLEQPSALEREVLGAIRYQANEAILHYDERLLPQNRRAWAAWNYHVPRGDMECACVTYNMNMLQSIDAPQTLCVTLNRSEAIDPDRVLRRMTYHHPVFTPAALQAQAEQPRINGADRIYYAGAYWRNGFHEDGVVSALEALEHFARDMRQDAQRTLHRTA